MQIIWGQRSWRHGGQTIWRLLKLGCHIEWAPNLNVTIFEFGAKNSPLYQMATMPPSN